MTKKLMLELLVAASCLQAWAQSPADTACHARYAREEQMNLEQLFGRLEENSKSLRSSKTGVEIAEQGIESAKSKRLPDINTSFSASYIGNALMTDRDLSNARGLRSPHFGNSFAVEASQVVYSGGALNAGIKLAEIGKQQAETGVRLTRSQSRFVALGQYLDLYKADNSIKVYEKNIALTEKLINEIKEKQNQGMALKNDITRYELQMENLRLGLVSMQNNRAILNHRLCNTLGCKADVKIIPDSSIAGMQFADNGEGFWQNRAAENSPLMEQSTLNVSMAKQNEKLARSEMLPKVAVVAANNFNGPITYELPPVDKNINVWYVGVGVKYSLSSLFKNNKDLKQAKIATRQMQENLSLQAEELNNLVQQAYTEYRQSYVELATRQKSVELARQNYDVMHSRYNSDMVLVTDMADASNLRLNAELQEVDARINIAYAFYKLKYAAGEL